MKPNLAYTIDHYNEIPTYCIGTRILDVGSSDCYGAYYSRHQSRFILGNYQGVDIQHFTHTYLPVVTCDIFDFTSKTQFDTILLLHVLEHFGIEQWTPLLQKIDALLKPKGFMVVNVPLEERNRKEENITCSYMLHKVSEIDEDLLIQHWPFHKFYRVGRKKQKVFVFRNKGESLLRACVRFVWRVFTNHEYSFINRYKITKRPKRLIAIYQKPRSEEE
ncbi:MAG: class I SAM-dependent methyltransferase [Candidatus Thorarchaeota archaeon]